MSAASQLFSDLVSLALLLVPGWIWSRVLRPRPSLIDAVSETGLLAVTVVSLPVFTICMLTRTFIDATWVTLASVLVTALGLAVLYKRHGSGLTTVLRQLGPTTGHDRVALAVAAAIFLFFLVNYDRGHFQYGCINGVVMQALTPEAANAFDPHGDKDENAVESTDWGAPEAPTSTKMNLLDVHGTGQRLGTTAVISPVVAIFDVFGFRLVYATLPALCMLFGYRLIRRLTLDPLAGLLGATIAVINPYVSKIVILDENVMAFSFATAALALLVEHREATDEGGESPHLVLAGIAFGAALGIRHIDLPFAFAAAVLIGRSPRALVAFGVATTLAALPCALHHHFTYGSMFQHEHFVDEVFQSWPHSFMGRQFEYTGLLNWPFYGEYIRTPYNPFPTAFYYPLNILAHLGTIMSAVAVVGVLQLTLRRVRLSIALLLWAAPQYALLAVLENWMDPNKLGVVISLFPILLVALGLGFHAMRSWVGLGLVAILAGVLTLVSFGADTWTFPDDERFYGKYPRVRKELAEYYDYERGLLATGSPLPSGYFFQQYTLFRLTDRLSMLATDWSDRRFRRPAPPIATATTSPVDVHIDFSRPFMGRQDVVVAADNPGAIIDVRPAETQLHLTGLNSWVDDREMELLIARNRTHEVVVYVRFGEDGFADVSSDRVFSLEQRERSTLMKETLTGTALNLRLRDGDRLLIYETVCLDEVLVYVWETDIRAGALETHPPRKMFHN